MNKLERLAAYIEAVAKSDKTLETYREYENDIKTAQAEELFELFYDRLQKGETEANILTYLDKLMHVFYQSLKHHLVILPEDSFLDHLDQENKQLATRLEQIKKLLRENNVVAIKEVLFPLFDEHTLFDSHYVKKENILFPYLEKKNDYFNGVSIMWSLHDKTRKSLQHVLTLLQEENPSEDALNRAIGQYFFDAYGLIQKEESILFVVAMDVCSINELEHMRQQSFEYPFCFISTPKYREVELNHQKSDEWLYTTKTGSLTFEQLTLFLDTLPMDCTIVDENNKVIYFNNPKDRYFPRSPAVIGRDVRNCHPAESVDVVDRIVEAFRNQKKDVASFWIDFKGRKILIQYYAMRDEENDYKGVIEISQDITDIQSLEGQRRLLDWD